MTLEMKTDLHPVLIDFLGIQRRFDLYRER
jgi:hypothetical protein